MKERPILFKADMVNAILEGRKTQTRRVIKPTKDLADGIIMIDYEKGDGWEPFNMFMDSHIDYDGMEWRIKCPYGKVGDQLWVRETFQEFETHPPSGIKQVIYRADGKGIDEFGVDEIIWKPSIFMPRKASRIQLEITDIRVERLQEISEDDAIREGVDLKPVCGHEIYPPYAFQELWESINGKGSWSKNPWVWVIEFKVLENG